MKKFDFRLSGALRVREIQLEIERAQLQRLLAEKQRMGSALRSLAESRQDATTFVRKTPELMNTDLRALSAFLVGTQHRALAVQKSIQELSGRIRKQQEAVLDASRRVRLLEKVRDRKFVEWSAEANREVEALAQEVWSSAQFATRTHSKTEWP